MQNKDVFVSVIIPICQKKQQASDYIMHLCETVSEHFENYELVLVDDGTDRTFKTQMNSKLISLPGIRYLRLSRSSGIELAINAGFESVIGDICVVLIPGIDPAENLLPMIELCQNTGRVVLGQFAVQVNPLYRFAKAIFYSFCRRWLEIPLVENVTYCIAIQRTALNTILQIREKFQFFNLFVGQVGLEYETFSYVPLRHPGISYGRGLTHALAFAIDVVIGNSLRPLRIASFLALMLSLINLAYSAYAAFALFAVSSPARGGMALSLFISLNAFILFSLGMIALEYLRSLVIEGKDRPSYFILDQHHNPLSVENENRLNVVQ